MDRFFLKAVDADVHVERDSTGAITELVLLQNSARVAGRSVTPASA